MSTSYKDHTDEVLSALDEAIEKGLTAIGMAAEAHAKRNLYPGHGLDTGRLRNSVGNQVVMDEKAVYIGTNVEYAPYVELGTSRSRPKPFLKPAATEHTAEYKQIMKDAMKTALKSADKAL
jgi:HK97 gp10 family phage protein